jgi:hypothetical protein
MHRTIASLCIALALAAAPALADAQQSADPPAVGDEAQRAIDEGVVAERVEDFASAVTAYERALSVRSEPSTWLRLASANRALSRYSEAVAAWDRYLESAARTAEPEELARVRALREAVAAQCTRVRLRFRPANAELSINGRLSSSRRSWSIVAADGARELLLDPGEYRLIVRATGFEPWSRVVSAPERGVQRSFDVELVQRDRAAAARVAGRPIPWWTFVGAGVFAGGAAAATVIAVQKVNAEAGCGNNPTCLESIAAANETRGIGIGISASIAAGGLILAISGVISGTTPQQLAPSTDSNQSPAMRTP